LKTITCLLLINTIATFFRNPGGHGAAPTIFPGRQGLEHPAIFVSPARTRSAGESESGSIASNTGKANLFCRIFMHPDAT